MENPLPDDDSIVDIEVYLDAPPEKLTPRRIFLEALLVSTLVAVVVCMIQTLIWDAEKRSAGSVEKYHWTPIDDLAPILAFMPLGFLVHSLMPWGWLYWTGVFTSIGAKSRWGYWLCAVAAVIFGLKWPAHFVGMMGV
ncbi:hypothetical protein GC176_08970 [bacterium]|nr:hypothetical protein [bacterium]